MKFENLAKTWDSFGEKDPLWAILAWEGKKDNKWNSTEFFNVGEDEVNYILSEAEKRSRIVNKNRSLDFGCGVGRLTFPLGKFFNESHGVDIAKPMIAKANEFRTQKGVENCIFHLNRKENLEIFCDDYFDFILSIIVLQHMESSIFQKYIKELVRVLKKGGVLVFQLPDETENRANYEEFEDNIEPVMEMYGMRKETIIEYLKEHKAIVLDICEDNSCGDDLKSFRYYVTK